jgi:hypothetical protein
MKSKWLDWSDGSGIPEKSTNTEPTKLTKPSFVGSVGSMHSSPSSFLAPGSGAADNPESAAITPSDPYSDRLQTILQKTCRPDYPAGMILWLRDSCPILYVQLTDELPNEIHRLWSELAPLEQFDLLIARWLKTHTTACELFKTSVANKPANQASEKRDG